MAEILVTLLGCFRHGFVHGGPIKAMERVALHEGGIDVLAPENDVKGVPNRSGTSA